MDILDDHEILLGTYEAFVLGYKLQVDAESGNPELKTSFANHAHSSTVRSLAAADKFMVTSGADENVKIFNLRNRTEHGNLTHSDGTLNCMTFYDKKHLVTGSEDNNICIIKATSSWPVEKTLAKHQGGVTGLAVHPSGKLMLSIGNDNKLVTWNLIKGRSAYVTNVKERPDFVKWSPSGTHYVVGFYKHVDVYSVASAAVEHSISVPGRSNDLVFLDDTTFALGAEMPEIALYSIVSGDLVTKFEAHKNRVRCLATVQSPDQQNRWCLLSASNDGFLKVWSVTRTSGEFKAKMVASVDTKCRVTCMVAHRVPEVVQLVKKAEGQKAAAPDQEDLEESEEEEDDDSKHQVEEEETKQKSITKKKKRVQVIDSKIEGVAKKKPKTKR